MEGTTVSLAVRSDMSNYFDELILFRFDLASYLAMLVLW
jgi:hypothetical protein